MALCEGLLQFSAHVKEKFKTRKHIVELKNGLQNAYLALTFESYRTEHSITLKHEPTNQMRLEMEKKSGSSISKEKVETACLCLGYMTSNGLLDMLDPEILQEIERFDRHLQTEDGMLLFSLRDIRVRSTE